MANVEIITLTVNAQNDIEMEKNGQPFNGELRISKNDKVLFLYPDGAIGCFIKSYTPVHSRRKRTLRARAANYGGQSPFHRNADGSRGVLQLDVRNDVRIGDQYEYALVVVRPNGRVASLDPQIIVQ